MESKKVNNDFCFDFIKVKHLYDFITDYIKENKNQTSFILPITPPKAINQQINTVADAEDVGLVIIYKHKICIGYVGLIPSLISTSKGNSKFYWMSPWYIHSDYRGQGVGTLLINEIKKLNYNIGSIHPLNGAYIKLDFFTVKPLKIHRINYAKYNIVKYTSLANSNMGRRLKVLYTPIKLLFQYLLCVQNKLDKSLYHVETQEILYDTRKYISTNRIERKIEDINNMLQHPWITEGEKLVYPNYHFSHTRGLFKYKAYYIFDALTKDKIGFAVFLISIYNGAKIIKLCDYEGYCVKTEKYIMSLAFNLSKKYKTDFLEFSNEIKVPKKTFYKMLNEKYERNYIFYSKDANFKKQIVDINLNYYDGDQNYW